MRRAYELWNKIRCKYLGRELAEEKVMTVTPSGHPDHQPYKNIAFGAWYFTETGRLYKKRLWTDFVWFTVNKRMEEDLKIDVIKTMWIKEHFTQQKPGNSYVAFTNSKP